MGHDGHHVLPLTDGVAERLLLLLDLGHVGEGEHRAAKLRPVDERTLGPPHRNRLAVAPPENVDTVGIRGFPRGQSTENPRLLPGTRGAVRMRVVKDVVEVAPDDLVLGVPQEDYAGPVEGDAPSLQVHPEDAVSRGLEHGIDLPAGAHGVTPPHPGLSGESLQPASHPAHDERRAQRERGQRETDPRLELPRLRHAGHALLDLPLDGGVQELGSPLDLGIVRATRLQRGGARGKVLGQEDPLIGEVPSRGGGGQLGQPLANPRLLRSARVHVHAQVFGQHEKPLEDLVRLGDGADVRSAERRVSTGQHEPFETRHLSRVQDGQPRAQVAGRLKHPVDVALRLDDAIPHIPWEDGQSHQRQSHEPQGPQAPRRDLLHGGGPAQRRHDASPRRAGARRRVGDGRRLSWSPTGPD